jgi:hypothetical protein
MNLWFPSEGINVHGLVFCSNLLIYSIFNSLNVWLHDCAVCAKLHNYFSMLIQSVCTGGFGCSI